MATKPANASLTPESQELSQPAELLQAQVNGLLAICIIFLVLCTASVGARVYVRARLVRAFGIDDWFTCITLLLFWIYGVLLANISTRFLANIDAYAAGEIPITTTIPYMIVTGTCAYAAVMIAFKFAVGYFFIKIFSTNRLYRILIYISIALSTLFGAFHIIWTGLYPCQVHNQFFIGLDICTGQTQRTDWLIITALFSLFTALTDFLYAALSIIALRKVQIPEKARWVAGLLCLIGSVGGIASFVRCGLILGTIPKVSQLGESILAAIWSVIEPGLGIVAASLVTLRPLFKKLNEGSRRTNGTTSRDYYSGQTGHRSVTTTRVAAQRGNEDIVGKPEHDGILVEVELDQWRRQSNDEESQQGKSSINADQNVDQEAVAANTSPVPKYMV
ncbi:hypothetical protein CAC42_5218 [Sphaceloma murrayae]|uniref:Rhodopsin domain-containing protein n=1 Tax=Sphaceloma murrayae TaxID=2082308 RepID=A0A2K1QUJ0_9PEZI|nr:hypothetical protein CAC42_5218 [Sphaceloma murrayae]